MVSLCRFLDTLNIWCRPLICNSQIYKSSVNPGELFLIAWRDKVFPLHRRKKMCSLPVKLCELEGGSHRSVVGLESMLLAERPWVRIPCWAKTLLSSPKRPDLLWAPSQPSVKRVPGSFAGYTAAGV